MDEILRKPAHYTVMLGHAHVEKNKPYGNGNRPIWTRNKKRMTQHIGRRRRWTWKRSHGGVTKTEIDYIAANKPNIVTDVTTINYVNTRGNHGTVICNMKVDLEVERKTILNKVSYNCYGRYIQWIIKIMTSIAPISSESEFSRVKNLCIQYSVFSLSRPV